MLYIRRLRLSNWTGIHAGTGMGEIEIDFPDPSTLPSRIVLFMGENGSGKSTALSALHPFASSFDGRDESQVREGTEGVKEVEIVRGDDVFLATHMIDRRRSAVKTRSFLEKNGVVLNENGLVGSFHDALLQELGLEEGFFKVGRVVNSGGTNFVDLSASQRKDFITSQLPDLEPWLAAFREAGRKCLSSEKTLKFLGDEISRLPERAKLDADRAQADRVLKAASASLSAASKARGAAEAEVGRLLASDDVRRANELDEAAGLAREAVAAADARIAAMLRQWTGYSGLAGDAAAIRSKIEDGIRKSEQLGAESREAAKRLEDLRASRQRARNKLDAKGRELARYADIDGLDRAELTLAISERESKLARLKAEAARARKNLGPAAEYADSIPLKRIGGLEAAHRSLCEKVGKMLEEIGTSPEGAAAIALAAGTGEKAVEDLRRRAAAATKKAEGHDSRVDSLRGVAMAAEMLSRRPKACKLDNCHFVVEGRRGKEAEAEIQAESAAAAEARGEARLYESAATVRRMSFAVHDHMANADTFGPVFAALLEKNAPAGPGAKKARSGDHVGAAIELGHLKFSSATEPRLLMAAIEGLSEIRSEEDALSSEEKRMELLTTSGALLTSIRTEMSELESEDERLGAGIEEADGAAAAASRELARVDSALSALRALAEATESKASAEAELRSAAAATAESRRVLGELSEKREALAELEESEARAEAAVEAARLESEGVAARAAKLDEYESRRDEFQAAYLKQSEVRQACDPKRGLPLAFMREFLEGTRDMANGLFDMAFRGRFRVDFVVTEKEFRIQVEKDDGDVLSDVKLASDGERAFIKTIISLSLLSCYAGVFPVLALDEVDAVLDSHHRTSFADIIEGQIRQLRLGQVFVISHNEEFRNENVPVVLFPGHTLGRGDGNRIIADFGEKRR